MSMTYTNIILLVLYEQVLPAKLMTRFPVDLRCPRQPSSFPVLAQEGSHGRPWGWLPAALGASAGSRSRCKGFLPADCRETSSLCQGALLLYQVFLKLAKHEEYTLSATQGMCYMDNRHMLTGLFP